MEEGGQTYAEAFKDYLWRIPIEDGGYHYQIESRLNRGEGRSALLK